MRNKFMIAALAAVSAIAFAAPATAQSANDEARFDQAQARFDREMQIYRDEVARYRNAMRYRGGGGYRGSSYQPYDRDDGDWDAARYYRDDPRYRERVLASDDRVYRGTDGRYYCRRSDGTTGLIVGAGVGGVLGNVIDGGRSRTVGTLLGAAAGALAGRAVERSNDEVRCR